MNGIFYEGWETEAKKLLADIMCLYPRLNIDGWYDRPTHKRLRNTDTYRQLQQALLRHCKEFWLCRHWFWTLPKPDKLTNKHLFSSATLSEIVTEKSGIKIPNGIMIAAGFDEDVEFKLPKRKSNLNVSFYLRKKSLMEEIERIKDDNSFKMVM